MRHWRHKMALERWLTQSEISFHCSPGVGESTFRTAISKGWLETALKFPADLAWWKKTYRLTDIGRAALREMEVKR
jgi:DNA-binding PadR family transcriptional regulator